MHKIIDGSQCKIKCQWVLEDYISMFQISLVLTKAFMAQLKQSWQYWHFCIVETLWKMGRGVTRESDWRHRGISKNDQEWNVQQIRSITTEKSFIQTFLLIFIIFRGKLAKIIGWFPSPFGLAPSWHILDPPLEFFPKIQFEAVRNNIYTITGMSILDFEWHNPFCGVTDTLVKDRMTSLFDPRTSTRNLFYFLNWIDVLNQTHILLLPVVSIALITDEFFVGSSEIRTRPLRVICTRNIHGSGREDRDQMSNPPHSSSFSELNSKNL